MPPTNICTCGVLQSNTKPELKTQDCDQTQNPGLESVTGLESIVLTCLGVMG